MAQQSKRTAAAESESPAKPPWFERDGVLGWALVLAVVVAYLPVWHAGFIWDDDDHLTANPTIVGPLGFKEIWTTSAADISPFTRSTFWLEHALWGLVPAPYHVVNVLMHGACAVVLWRVLRRLRVPGAWLGAALWALHPVEVESVAWITEMKNTESGLFFLLAILFFVRSLEARAGAGQAGGRWNYGLALLFAAMAMASKSSTVVLPAVLCLCAWWLEGRWQWRNLARVAPFFLMTLAASAVSLGFQGRALAVVADPLWTRTWPQRLAGAGDAVWFYLGKLLWPHPLITVYPRWNIDPSIAVSYLPSLLVIVVLFVLWFNRGSWARPWFFVFSYFLVALLPVLGLFDNTIFRYSLVFDHFQYLASMGPLALAGAGLARLADSAAAAKSWWPAALAAGLLLVLGTASWQRTRVYRNEETLWTDALAKNPACWAGYNNLGYALLNRGQVDEAIADFQKALELYPNYDLAHDNLGAALLQKGQVDAAMDEYRKALAISPDSPVAFYNLGVAYAQKGQMEEAIDHYRTALKINPAYVQAYNNLGLALFKEGRVDEAIAEYRKALAINPNLAQVHNDLGLTLAQKGDADAAVAEYRRAIEIAPGDADAHYNLALTYSEQGQVDDAIAEYQAVLAINPNNGEARFRLGNELLREGRIDEAIVQYQKALELNPDNPEIHTNLGNALMQKGGVDDAIAQYKKGLEINPNLTQAHNNLGVALLHKGQIDAAVVQFQEVVRLNPNDGSARSNLAKVQAVARQVRAR